MTLYGKRHISRQYSSVGALTIQQANPAIAPADQAVDNGNRSVIWTIPCAEALYDVNKIAFKNPKPSSGGTSPVNREVACRKRMSGEWDLREVIN